MFLLLYNDLSICRNDSLFQDPRQWGKQTWEKLHKNCMGAGGYGVVDPVDIVFNTSFQYSSS